LISRLFKPMWFDKKVLILIEKVNKNYRLSINRGQLFGSEIDFSQLVKIYGNTEESQKRYSPAQCIGTEKIKINGNPEKESVSTSYVKRQNLTMRMNMRRFTRLTNAFSKKVENLGHARALHFMYYNFCRIHQTLRVTPAMEAGITDHVWTLGEIVNVID